MLRKKSAPAKASRRITQQNGPITADRDGDY